MRLSRSQECATRCGAGGCAGCSVLQCRMYIHVPWMLGAIHPGITTAVLQGVTQSQTERPHSICWCWPVPDPLDTSIYRRSRATMRCGAYSESVVDLASWIEEPAWRLPALPSVLTRHWSLDIALSSDRLLVTVSHTSRWCRTLGTAMQYS